jgi:hypothetical protein
LTPELVILYKYPKLNLEIRRCDEVTSADVEEFKELVEEESERPPESERDDDKF